MRHSELGLNEVDDGALGEFDPGSTIQAPHIADAVAVAHRRTPFHFLPRGRPYIEMSLVRVRS
ncbi:hypothetical protein DLJ47_18015 [Micromonospora sp. S4605]|nr:hypothetical protein DLJ47_18015 [Micromonospora sp. S4605]